MEPLGLIYLAGMIFTGFSIIMGFSQMNGPASSKDKQFIIASALIFAMIWPLFYLISLLSKDRS
ncbi:membrane protein [Microbacterium phage Pumpernickel]|uniref:Membrane protein n=1 Tax=Microbacterium phage Pumpernickel TaxID=2885983 RepID=A0AAE8Y7B0_9CAUD|nr:membrane protein [Microbacterium phage Pumpernickel]UDL15990.1 membrane protein [Microbacterium phage Pumpernickel]